MPGIRSAMMINGVPVITAPPEIDVTTAEQLRAVLTNAGSHGHAAVVVDMTRTRCCDSSGLSVLVQAHRPAAASPVHPRPSAGVRSRMRQPGPPGRGR